MPARSQGSGGYTPSELHTEILPSRPRDGAGVILVAHGGGGTAAQYDPLENRRDLMHLADLGFLVGIANFGGGYAAVTDGGLSATDAYLTWLGTKYSWCDTSRVGWVADSFGCFLVMTWAKENPSRFGGGIMRVPGTNLAELYQRNPLGALRAGVLAAYGSEATMLAEAPQHDPSHPTFIAALLAARVNDRMVFRYNPGDSVVLESVVLASAEELQVRAEVLAPPAKTGVGFVAHAPWTHVDAVEQGRWLRERMSP